MHVDLHTHTDCSDGALSPEDLVALAASAGVKLLSVTDHDTAAGCRRAKAACERSGIAFLSGVELSVRWAGSVLHVVGLGFDPEHPQAEARFAQTSKLRALRGIRIGEAFDALGLSGAYEGALAYAESPETLSRTHFAAWLVETGVVKNTQQAFDRYLREGGPAYVEAPWPTMEEGVRFLTEIGALPILAHPGRYRFREAWAADSMVDAFVAAGGRGIEVSSGSQSLEANDFFADMARARGLLASTGSDWHSDRSPRPRPGLQAAIPPDLTPVWTLFGYGAHDFD